MKRTGIARKIDGLGRIVLPVEIRDSLRLRENDKLEIMVDDGDVILRPVRLTCFFCDSMEDVKDVDGIGVCQSCAERVPLMYDEAD